MRHLFILNPKAGSKNQVRETVEKIRQVFESLPGEEYRVLLTQKRGDAAEMAREASREDGFVRLYACGGDGTLHEVVNGAAESQRAAICPIPLGSGNDLIRSFDQFSKADFLDLAACVRGSVFPCDLLRCGSVYSINNISVGLDALAARRQNKVKNLPFISGGAAYKLALGYSFLSSMKNPVTFEVDGESLVVGNGNVTLAVLGNGRFYGGGFQAVPLATINDGYIDFLTVPTISRLEFLRYVGDYRRGDHLKTMPSVHYQKCKKIRLLSPHPICLQADGEILECENPEIEIIPQAIQLILPAKGRANRKIALTKSGAL